MLKRVHIFFRFLFVLLYISCFAIKANASHLFGADFIYKWKSDSTYTIIFTVYGDCSGSAFPSLSSSSPEVEIFNGTTLFKTIDLKIQAPSAGVEVTPVCAKDTNNTTCRGGTVPGVTKFVYSADVTLTGKSSDWVFLFDGVMSFSTSAGRSNSITNISIPSTGSIMQLRDTLNNLNGHNSSAVFTVIPTPFFCDGEPANYNPGAVDSNSNDSLVFSLVPGIDATSGTVSYLSGYSATSPLSATSGTFVFDSSTGQISFTPNALQRSLVVEQVDQYRNDTLVGTSMREMTFVVLNCTNAPPTGKISGAVGGTILDTTDFKVCSSEGSFSFQINPGDPDSTDITVSSSGLPSGATYTVTGNGTKTPKGTFSWSTSGVAIGTYRFFLTYIDDACPLASKQTQAYSITVLPDPKLKISVVSPATCVKKAVFTLTPLGIDSPWLVRIYSGSTLIDSFKNLKVTVTDSLSPGTYTIRINNKNNCYTDTVLTLASPPVIIPKFSMTTPVCVGDSNGKLIVTATGGLAPFKYAFGSGSYSTIDSLIDISAGPYTVHIVDSNSCRIDTTITLSNPPAILARVTFKKPPCNHFKNGSISIVAYNSTGPYQYALDTGAFDSSGVFSNLYSGPYTVHIKNGLGCVKDTLVQLPDSVKISASIAITNEPCFGDTSGVITITAKGGYGPPFVYALDSNTFVSTNVFKPLAANIYTVHIEDTVLCHFDTVVAVIQPKPIAFINGIKNVDCYGNSTGSDTVHTSGGTPPYQYSINGSSFVSSNVFTGLKIGTYSITIKDSNNCSGVDTFTITQPTPLSIQSIITSDPSCHGFADGQFIVTASGGTSPYEYTIDTTSYSTSDTILAISAGPNTIYVKDSNGCVKDTTVTVSQPSVISIWASVANSVCSTLANGKIILHTSGGTPGYKFELLGTGTFTTDSVFSPLSAALYHLNVLDSNGCFKDTSITISDSFHLSQTEVITQALCYDSGSGIIVVTPAGGTNPYTFSLSPGPTGSSSDTFLNVLSGSYVVEIKDTNGCKNDSTVFVGQPSVVTPLVTITEPSCYGFNNGSVTISATGGTPGYTYAFDSSALGAITTFTNLQAGIDTVYVKDNNGCLHDSIFTIAQPASMIFDSLVLSNVKCFGDNSGSVKVVATGGTVPYKYAANSSAFQVSDLLTGLYVGAQVIHLKDTNGCTLDSTVTLTQPNPLLVAVDSLVTPTCQGYKDGLIEIGGTGGTLPYQYSTDGKAYNDITLFPNLQEGSYIFYVHDSNNCTHDTTIQLIGYPHININGADIQGVTCYGLQNGIITINASGGVSPLMYQIDGYSPVSSNVFDSVLAGSYDIIIVDSKNCKKDTTVIMPQPDILALTTTINPNQCIGLDTNGQVRVDVTGGTQPYTYTWSTDPPQTTNILTGMPNGNYMVWVHDKNNCTDSSLAVITYNDCCKPFIPSAFTPNGDGKNDVFRVLFKGDMKLEEFSIYDRFGQRIFYTTNIAQGWDGKFNGVPMELGTYYYFLKAICGNAGDHEVFLKGDVTLIR